MKHALTYYDPEKERDNTALQLSGSDMISCPSLRAHAKRSISRDISVCGATASLPSARLPHSLAVPQKQSAFTLIELSIVLVIIGLIVGGVLVGQDLIKAAELRATYGEVQEIKTAVNAFRLKYNCIAGDCANAESFWGSDSSCPATPSTTGNSVAKEVTCNGNGDRKVGDASNTVGGTDGDLWYEGFRFWQQLANAELIKGRYSGTWGPGSSFDCVSDSNCYAPKMGGRFTIRYLVSTNEFPLPPAHWLTFAEPYTVAGAIYGAAINPVVSPIDALSLDTKFDDGLPGTGSILGTIQSYAYGNDCSSTDFASSAIYRADLSDKNCRMLFKMSNGGF